MNEDIERVLFDENELSKITKSLGQRITQDYKNKNLLIVSVLKGSIIFTADLVRAIELPSRIEFMQTSSYGSSSVSSGCVKIIRDIPFSIEEYDVLIVEDIIDSGYTLKKLVEHLKQKNAKSVNICTLLSKPSRRRVEVDVKYIGQEVPDSFIVGYGLDFADKYRSLPYIGVLKPQVYENQEV